MISRWLRAFNFASIANSVDREDRSLQAHRLEKERLFIDGNGGVAVVPVTPDVYTKIKDRTDLGGTLISYGVGTGAPSKSWEMHPKGEEILVILDGAPKIYFEHPDGRAESQTVSAGDAVIVPRGVWHRTEGEAGWRILYITYGAGTTHKPLQ
jgi:mannose-6-phosphate isomerase-like protein (cupin superfamily)